ncbi:MAG TPA: amino acid ABC transporter permease [Actinomycetota bacterium]|nr:amino acid ABC transporter permease [Actinomycetota bacterium]
MAQGQPGVVGEIRPPEAPPEQGGGGRMDRLALASAGVPFRLKVAIVWLAIFLVLGFFLSLAGFDWGWMGEKARFIAAGLTFTLVIAVSGIVIAIILAVLGALGRLSSNPVAYGASGFYTSFFRGTPLIVQMFLLYLALPQIVGGLQDRFPGTPDALKDVLTLDAIYVGIIALGLNYGAYMTEIFRAGIQSVGHGQGEAADALGMNYRRKMRRVVLPQAFRVIIPPTGNEFIAMMKDTALVSFLGVGLTTSEIFRRGQLVGKSDFKNLEALLLVAAMYWILTIIFTYFQSRLERRVSKGYVRGPTPGSSTGRKKVTFQSSGGGGGRGGGGGGVIVTEDPDGGGRTTEGIG